MSFSDDDVRKLALLARMEISDAEAAAMRPKLARIFGFVQKLTELDTDGVEPMTTALDVDNRWRNDVPIDGLTRDQALSNAPARDEECFLVPPVLGTAGTKK